MAYELTKIIGPIDFTGILVPEKLKDDFLERGHLTLSDQGDDYDPSDIVGGPLKFLEAEDGTLQLYAKLFDGPDLNCKKAHRLVQVIKQGRQQFMFKAIRGKTADGEKNKLRVALVQTGDKQSAISVCPTLSFDEQDDSQSPTISK